MADYRSLNLVVGCLEHVLADQEELHQDRDAVDDDQDNHRNEDAYVVYVLVEGQNCHQNLNLQVEGKSVGVENTQNHQRSELYELACHSCLFGDIFLLVIQVQL